MLKFSGELSGRVFLLRSHVGLSALGRKFPWAELSLRALWV